MIDSLNKNCINKCIAGRCQKEYYEDNKTRILEINKEWAENNKEKNIEYHKHYHVENLEKHNLQSRQNYIDNKEKYKALMKEIPKKQGCTVSKTSCEVYM